MAWRMDTPATGYLVMGRPSSGVTASSGQWEDNGLQREDPGDLTNRFQPEGCKRQLRGEEAQETLFTWIEDNGQRRDLGEVILDAQLESMGAWDWRERAGRAHLDAGET
ncbi:unnamed protein product [Caretta caretta]